MFFSAPFLELYSPGWGLYLGIVPSSPSSEELQLFKAGSGPGGGRLMKILEGLPEAGGWPGLPCRVCDASQGVQGQLYSRALLLSSSLPHPTQIPSVADPCCQARLPLPPIKPAAPLQTGELRSASLTCYPVAVTDCHVLPRSDRNTAPGDVICVQRFRVVILFEDTSAGKVLMQSSR